MNDSENELESKYMRKEYDLNQMKGQINLYLRDCVATKKEPRIQWSQPT